MTYVVHGATGAQGKPVLAALTAAGRSAVGLDRKGGTPGRGAAAVADYGSAEQLAEAYCGAAGVFVHLPLGSEQVRLRYALNIVAALAAARPGRVVISTSGQIIDEPGSPLQQKDDTALPTLLRGVADAGLCHAVIAPRIYLENLLLPPVIQTIRSEGVLRYPLYADLAVSWTSHLDVADAAVALFQNTCLAGVVAAGQHPPVTGPDLAAAFAARLGRSVAYEAITPEQFGALMNPVIGKEVSARVTALYTTIASLPALSFEAERGTAHRIGVTPRTTAQWLDDLGL